MPRHNVKLTDTAVRKAKAKESDFKLYDDGGLRILIRKTGTKVWQFPYKLYGKSNIYTIGHYPQVPMAEARRVRDEIKSLVEKGIDPNKYKASLKTLPQPGSTTFQNVALEWHSKQLWTKKHAGAILATLKNDVFPLIGSKEIADVTVKDVIQVLQRVESRGALDVAKRIGQRLTAIFDYAITLDLCENNPALGRSKLLKVRKVVHRPFLTEEKLPEFLQKLENYHGSKIVQLAMKFLILTFVRPGELRGATWDEVNFEKAEWRITAERMKMKRPHLVPLSPQALDVLKTLRPLTGTSKLLFPSVRNINKPISDVTLLKCIQILGYTGKRKIVPHGFRATASTILNERGKFRPDVIERQLAHIEENKVRAAYHRAEYIEERIEMMNWWAHFLFTH